MSATRPKLKRFASRLLELSKTDGIVDSAKVSTVIATLKTHRTKDLSLILQLYRDAVREDLRRSTAKVAYAGALSEAAKQNLLQTLEAKTGRKLILELHEDPSLIAGVKVTVADSVFEQSIRSMLSQIAALSA